MRVQLKDGSYEWIESAEQLRYLIKDCFGEDIANVLGDKIEELQEQADYTRQKVNTDLDAYAGSLESQKSAADDMNDYIEQTINYIDAHKRLDRNKLNEMLTAAHKKWYDNF